MRLVCPNCSAQYEIDGSMIPEEGRDVQCSNCGHTWFELPTPAETAVEEPTEFAGSVSGSEAFAGMQYDPDEEDAFDEIAEDTLTSHRDGQQSQLQRSDFDDVEAEFARPSKAEEPDETNVFGNFAAETNEPEEEPETAADVAPAPSEVSDDIEDHIQAVTEAHSANESTDELEETESKPADVSEPEEAADPREATVEDDVAEPDDDAQLAPPSRPARRPADMAALEILREEAERELSQRRTPPSQGIETQTDLGLEDIRNRRTPSRALRARMAHLGEEPPQDSGYFDDEEPSQEDAKPESRPKQSSLPHEEPEERYEEPRRDLLPDIEEINSTLKASSAGYAGAESQKRSGFRIGFLLMVFLAGAAIFAYAQAPAIARALPNAETSLISYVDWANGLRDRIDALIGN